VRQPAARVRGSATLRRSTIYPICGTLCQQRNPGHPEIFEYLSTQAVIYTCLFGCNASCSESYHVLPPTTVFLVETDISKYDCSITFLFEASPRPTLLLGAKSKPYPTTRTLRTYMISPISFSWLPDWGRTNILGVLVAIHTAWGTGPRIGRGSGVSESFLHARNMRGRSTYVSLGTLAVTHRECMPKICHHDQ
jgi:hypothetical protein